MQNVNTSVSVLKKTSSTKFLYDKLLIKLIIIIIIIKLIIIIIIILMTTTTTTNGKLLIHRYSRS